ncbi:MAG: hypothetical protein KGO81_01680 [Bacteroidota bacterium]|nr:hypothetical protein [Bacteroidota bacterium]
MANSLFQWLITGWMALMHPFYVSVIDINHNPKDKAVEISVRIFTEDLETTLNNNFHSNLHLDKKADPKTAGKFINQYILQKLQLKADGKPLNLQYVGYEIQEESTWCYFEVPNTAAPKKLDVNCNLLYDFQNQQINIFHVKVNEKEESYKLDNPKTQASFNF